MGKVKKVLLWIVGSFIALMVLSVVVATLVPSADKTEPPKKVVEVQKPKPQKKVVKKVEKPKPKSVAKKPTAKKPKPKVEKPVVKKQVRPEYTAEQVYRFALEYEVREGQSVADILALGVIAMKGSGHTVEVVERQAQEYSIKGLWVVSCVVVVDGFERTQLRWEADMRNKTVRPLNKVARDLWGY